MENLNFFAGLESLMEDPEVQASNPIEQGEPVENVVQDTVERAEEVAEIATEESKLETMCNSAIVLAGRIDQLERMQSYVKTYGVDRSFLSLCNYNDVLNKSFNMGLPATESFTTRGDVNSPESVAALEGFGEAVSKAYAWIKKQLAAIRDFFAGLWKKFIGLFKRNEESAKAAAAKADKAIKGNPNAANKPVKNKEDVGKIKEAAQQAAQSEVLNDATKAAAAKVATAVEQYEKAGTVGEAKKALDAVTANTAELAKAANAEAAAAQATAKQAAQAAEQIVANKGQTDGPKPTEQVKKATQQTKEVGFLGKVINTGFGLFTKGYNLVADAAGATKAAVIGVFNKVFSSTKNQYSSPAAANWASKYIKYKTTDNGDKIDDNLKVWTDSDKELIRKTIEQINAEADKVASSIDENAEGKHNI
jgi:hypothetical protein